MAVTANLTVSSETLNGETITYSDATTYGDPLRADVSVIVRAYHVDQDLVKTRKEFNTYDLDVATTFTLALDQTADDIVPIDGVHLVKLFILDDALYEGITGGEYQIDGADESSYTDAQLEALSSSFYDLYHIPVPKLYQEQNDVVRLLSDDCVDFDTMSLIERLLTPFAKREGAWAQFRMGNYSKAARILETE